MIISMIFLEVLVAEHLMHEPPTDDDLIVSDIAVGIAEVAEPTADEVYENFCRALYKPLTFRPVIRMLGMQPRIIF